jgi:hypothetical protein
LGHFWSGISEFKGFERTEAKTKNEQRKKDALKKQAMCAL